MTTLEPTAMAPELPALAASGLPGYEAIGMTGIFAVGDKAPNAIIARLKQEILKFAAWIETGEQFLRRGVEMVGKHARAVRRSHPGGRREDK